MAPPLETKPRLAADVLLLCSRWIEFAAYFFSGSGNEPRGCLSRWPCFGVQLIDRAIHRRLHRCGRSPFLTLAHNNALQARDDTVDCVIWVDESIGVFFDRAVDVDHLLAVRAPLQDL